MNIPYTTFLTINSCLPSYLRVHLLQNGSLSLQSILPTLVSTNGRRLRYDLCWSPWLGTQWLGESARHEQAGTWTPPNDDAEPEAGQETVGRGSDTADRAYDLLSNCLPWRRLEDRCGFLRVRCCAVCHGWSFDHEESKEHRLEHRSGGEKQQR